MIVSGRNGNRELRMFEASALIPRPGSGMALSGTMLRARQIGVAAVACAVQLVSESLGVPVMRVYTGDAEKRRPLLNAPQAALFQEPSEGETSFDLWADTSLSIELEQGAFLWKNMDRGEVLELIPVDPRIFLVTREKSNGPKKITARIDGRREDVTDKVIFIKGWSPIPGAASGLSKLELHDLPLRNALKLEEYRGRYFDNDGTPGVVLDASGATPTKLQRDELLQSWADRHSGEPGQPGMIWGDVKDVKQLAPTLQDAQAVELSNAIALDVARMWRIFPAELVHAAIGRPAPPKTAELWADIFLRFSLLHRMRRIERGIAADRDLFPDRRQYARFDIEELLRGDIATIAAMIHQLVQVGVLNPNEGRAYLGKGPRPGGEKFLETPVGAQANSDNAGGAGGDQSAESD